MAPGENEFDTSVLLGSSPRPPDRCPPDEGASVALSVEHTHAVPHPLLQVRFPGLSLPPKLHGPVFGFCNLFSEPISSRLTSLLSVTF